MPKTSSLLDDRERLEFARWLEQRRIESGCSRRDLVRALSSPDSDVGTQRVGRYLSAPRQPVQLRHDESPRPDELQTNPPILPTPEVLSKLADVIGLSIVPTLFRAGYNARVLGEIRKLDELAKQWMTDDRLADDDGVVRSRDVRALSSEQRARYESVTSILGRSVVAPRPRVVAIRIVIAWLLLRGDVPTTASDDFASALCNRSDPQARLLSIAGSAIADRPPQQWPPHFRYAYEMLTDTRFSRSARRFANAELLHDWARSIAPTVYVAVRREFVKGGG